MKKFHCNNKHKNGYNFELLSFENELLKPFLIDRFGKNTIDFSNPKAVKEFNKSLLKTHYKVSFWEFLDENLTPPIPSRVDYLHYLSDLLTNEKSVSILDIGTGASLVYPILGVSEFQWNFVASDIDQNSLTSAEKIINQNNFEDNIKLRFQSDKSHILEGIVTNDDKFTFTMCNPPFYRDLSEAKASNSRKNRNLKTTDKRNFAGNENELCYKGGEKAFLHTYLYESSKYSKVSKWFTSLVSKKENVKSLQESAKKLNVSEFKIIPMEQGNKITRIVCWRF